MQISSVDGFNFFNLGVHDKCDIRALRRQQRIDSRCGEREFEVRGEGGPEPGFEGREDEHPEDEAQNAVLVADRVLRGVDRGAKTVMRRGGFYDKRMKYRK